MTPTFVRFKSIKSVKLINTKLYGYHSVVVMDEGNSAAEAGIEGGVSYIRNNIGSVTTIQWLAFEDITGYRKPFLATEKCILF